MTRTRMAAQGNQWLCSICRNNILFDNSPQECPECQADGITARQCDACAESQNIIQAAIFLANQVEQEKKNPPYQWKCILCKRTFNSITDVQVHSSHLCKKPEPEIKQKQAKKQLANQGEKKRDKMKPKKDLHFNIICWNVRSIRMATRQEMIFEQLKLLHKPLEAIHLSETHLDGKLTIKRVSAFSSPLHKKGGVWQSHSCGTRHM